MSGDVLGGKIPEFGKKTSGGAPSLTSPSLFGAGSDSRNYLEIATIIMVAVIIIGGAELLIRWLEVPNYVMPPPSAIVYSLFG